jgi:hypothetical protein
LGAGYKKTAPVYLDANRNSLQKPIGGRSERRFCRILRGVGAVGVLSGQ